MKKISAYSQKTDAKESEDFKKKEGIFPCDVYGCGWDGHIKINNTWKCRYHFERNTDAWAKITMMLHNHEYLFNWYEKVNAAPSIFFEQVGMNHLAPQGLEILPDENFVMYKKRLSGMCADLLK